MSVTDLIRQRLEDNPGCPLLTFTTNETKRVVAHDTALRDLLGLSHLPDPGVHGSDTVTHEVSRELAEKVLRDLDTLERLYALHTGAQPLFRDDEHAGFIRNPNRAVSALHESRQDTADALGEASDLQAKVSELTGLLQECRGWVHDQDLRRRINEAGVPPRLRTE